jgi:hypothetical protein
MSDLPVATVVKAAKALLARTAPDVTVSAQETVVEAIIADEAAGAEDAPPALPEAAPPEVAPIALASEEASPQEAVVEAVIAEEHDAENVTPLRRPPPRKRAPKVNGANSLG